MNQIYSLVSVYLPSPYSKHDVETRLACAMKKGIEKAFYAHYKETYLIYTQFNVLTFINWEKNAIVQALQKLDVKDAENFEQRLIYQDYPILIDETLSLTCKVDNDRIMIKEPSTLFLIIIALVVSQSVGLEKYEQDLTLHFERSRQLLDLTQSYSLFKRSKITEFARHLAAIQHGMVNDLFLLDKPNILWDDPEAETLYNRLSSVLELKDRFEIVEHKLSTLKDDISMALDLINHRHSEFLEWIIIVMIGFEIIMGLIEFFKSYA